MCETYKGRVENLDYKTIRYPGHAKLMNFFFHELLMRKDRKTAGEILTCAKPPVTEDVVYIHTSVEGWKRGSLSRDEFVRAYYPVEIAGQKRRAISWTTAASVCAVVEMVSDGALPGKGFLKQEEIPLAEFLRTGNGRLYAGEPHGKEGKGKTRLKGSPAAPQYYLVPCQTVIFQFSLNVSSKNSSRRSSRSSPEGVLVPSSPGSCLEASTRFPVSSGSSGGSWGEKDAGSG